MPFGLKNAPATFQHFINDVLGEYLDEFAFAYIDDILIYSNTLEEHRVHVKKILKRLQESGLYAKLSKCEFEVQKTTFLGHVISNQGISMDPDKVKSILEWPIPTTVKEVQSFIGLCNYYRRFIPNFAKIAKPLHNLTRKDIKYEWTEECSVAFETLKKLFTIEPILAHADPELPFIVETDASNFAIGAVLSQRNKDTNELHPICYYSRGLSKSERNYPIYDKELLAVKCALQEWRHYLEGSKHQFTIFTDHKNRTFPRKPELLSQRQIRWNLFLSRFDYKLQYRPGKEGGKPDAFSRRPDYEDKEIEDEEDSTPCFAIMDLDNNSYPSIQGQLKEELIKNTKEDKFIQELISVKKGVSTTNNKYKSKMKDFELEEDGLLLYKGLIFVPNKMKDIIIGIHHDNPVQGHFGILKTKEVISRNFVWFRMTDDIVKYIASCKICCQAKDDRHKPYGLLQPLPTPKRPWSYVSMDFITDLPKSRDKSVIMVIVDRLTKMAHFIPFRNLPTAVIAADVFFREIFRLHGLPDDIVSDRGSQFTSEFWTRLCSLLDIRQNLSTAHHPQTDGQTERVNGILEQFLRCYINKRKNNWMDILPYAEFAYNNTLQQSTNQTPFFSNYGFNPKFNPVIPADSRRTSTIDHVEQIRKNMQFLKKNLEKAKERYKRYADHLRIVGPKLKVGDKVWLKRPDLLPKGPSKLTNRKLGPFKIIEKTGPVSYKLELPDTIKCHNVFHISNLEPYNEREFDESSASTNTRITSIATDTEGKEPLKIVAAKVVNNKPFYFILWKGLPATECTWLSEEEISDPQLVQEFNRTNRVPSRL